MRLGEFAIGFVIGAWASGTGAIIGTTYLAKWALSPKQAYVLEVDFNLDEVPDLVIEQAQGRKVPMYGIREGENIRYVSAPEIMRKYPNVIFNYETLETKLNE